MDSTKTQTLTAVEFLFAQGDQTLTKFQQFCSKYPHSSLGSTGDQYSSFNYNKHFNLRGFYDFSSFEIIDESTGASAAKPASLNEWGIEEVDPVDKWQIIEDDPSPTNPPVGDPSDKSDDFTKPSTLLDASFRDQLAGELELLGFYFTERKLQASVSNPMLLLDPELAVMQNALSLEEIQQFITAVKSVHQLVEDASFKQNLSFYESEKGRDRLRAAIEVFDSNLKRKERQLWKLSDSIKELKTNVSDAEDQLQSLHKQINELRVAAQQHLGTMLKRNVVIPSVTL